MKDIIDDGPSIILDTCEGVVGDSVGSEQVAHIVQGTVSLKPDHEETKFDYRKLLADHDEIEDMTCSICMELMDVGQTIVKTNCQQQVVAQSDMNSIFPNDAAEQGTNKKEVTAP